MWPFRNAHLETNCIDLEIFIMFSAFNKFSFISAEWKNKINEKKTKFIENKQTL